MGLKSLTCRLQWWIIILSLLKAVSGHDDGKCLETAVCLNKEQDCLAWHVSTNNINCSCVGNSHGDVITKDKLTNATAAETAVLLEFGYCMTNENLTTHLIPCPYDTALSHVDMMLAQAVRMNTVTSNLTNFTCSQLYREGKHCANCMSGYGQSIYSLDLNCYSCSTAYRGWGLYLLFEFVPLTAFIFIILILRLSPTNPNLKSYVLFSQLITIYLSLGYEAPYKHIFGENTKIFVKLVKTAYGFWNLDFFRTIIPPFCVSEDLNNLEVLSFHYLSVIYPTLFVFIAWVIVELHERGSRPIVRAWKPFRRYLSHYSVTNEPKRIIISFLATVVILSYTKVLFLSVNLISVVEEHTLCKNHTEGDNNKVLYLQPDMKYFQGTHIPFILLAFVMFMLYNILPLLILILYPSKWVQEKLKSFWVRQNNIQLFAEAVYGCYVDGTNDQQDRRFFSTVYLFVRIFLVLLYAKGTNYTAIPIYITAAVIHGIVVGLLLYRKPYKKEPYIYLDIVFFFAMGVALLFAAIATHNNTSTSTIKPIFALIFTVMLLPLFYACVRVLIIFVRWFKLINIRSFLQRRRRGYQEITEYGEEPETSISETDQNRYERSHREREGDSFQSE